MESADKADLSMRLVNVLNTKQFVWKIRVVATRRWGDGFHFFEGVVLFSTQRFISYFCELFELSRTKQTTLVERGGFLKILGAIPERF